MRNISPATRVSTETLQAASSLVVAIFLLIGAAVAHAQQRTPDTGPRDALVEQYLRGELPVYRFLGAHTVLGGTIVRGHLFHEAGRLTIGGVVEGSVLCLNGDVVLTGTARVAGDVVSVNGEILADTLANIGGELLQTVIRSLRPAAQPAEIAAATTPYSEPSLSRPSLLLRYNRVDGFVVGGELPLTGSRRIKGVLVQADGHSAYGFASKAFRFAAGLEFSPASAPEFAAGAKYADRTVADYDWAVTTGENSVAALLLHEDFFDYYRERGGRVFGRIGNAARGKIEAGFDWLRWSALPNATEWAVLGGGKRFRENEPAEAGRGQGIRVKIDRDTMDHPFAPGRGVRFELQSAWFDRAWGSDFTFSRHVAELRLQHTLQFGKQIGVRVRAGSGNGPMPRHLRFHLGGPGSLPGFRHRQFSGDRMVLINAEFRLNAGASWLTRLPGIDAFDMVVFADAGHAWESRDGAGFAPAADIGFAITEGHGRVRLNFAVPVTHPGPLRVTFRLERPF